MGSTPGLLTSLTHRAEGTHPTLQRMEEHLVGGGVRTWLPVQREGQVLCGLEIISPRALSRGRLALVQGMCSLYANHLSLLEDSQVDTLTRLLNRKTFDDSMRRLLETANGTSWVAVIDIDHFKRINDSYGHLFGDEVLLLVAGLLQRAFRANDKVFRFGGEEFVVLLHGTTEPGTQQALDRFRTTVEQFRFPQIGQVTVSIGATRMHPGDSGSAVLGRADQALYYAKSHGRNQLRLYEHLRAEGDITPATHAHGDVDLF